MQYKTPLVYLMRRRERENALALALAGRDGPSVADEQRSALLLLPSPPCQRQRDPSPPGACPSPHHLSSPSNEMKRVSSRLFSHPCDNNLCFNLFSSSIIIIGVSIPVSLYCLSPFSVGRIDESGGLRVVDLFINLVRSVSIFHRFALC